MFAIRDCSLFAIWVFQTPPEKVEISSILLSTKDDVLLKIGEAKYKLVFNAADDILVP